MGKHDFVLQKEISDGLTQETRKTFLASMEQKKFKAGERLITRGERGDKLFIIQDGTCTVIIEKDGKAYPIVSLKSGDLAGEMALITGEPRTAHVDAETDVVVAEISREKFDAVCEGHPSLKEILSKIVQENIFSSIFKEQREVGKYNIQDILGKGGMSTVYKGVHRYINMPVVIKVLNHHMAMNPDFYNKFKEDAMKIVQLNHENIVTVFDIASLYRTIFIFREYLEGEPLHKILDKTSQQPLNRVIEFLLQICSGLAHSHKQGLIHQGIKPTNIFILPKDQVKLIDFGLAFPRGAIDVSLGERVQYMSPEQLEGERVDERTDIYSLGITAFEMITGQRPFPDHDVDKFIDLHATQEIPDPRSLRPDLPDELCRFIIQATQKSPDKRYQNVSEIISDLKPLAGI
ncbi:MAG: protein kinase [Thermodesulfobacteriota bacterium]|nr:protein kinase [Thermodesulfobacteriota bacterium]